MRNNGSEIAIPARGIGLLAPDQEFEVTDALGKELKKLDRFVEVQEIEGKEGKTEGAAKGEQLPTAGSPPPAKQKAESDADKDAPKET